MAFPPNYGQERNNRARAKAQKALDKRLKREEKSSARKTETPDDEQAATPATSRFPENT